MTDVKKQELAKQIADSAILAVILTLQDLLQSMCTDTFKIQLTDSIFAFNVKINVSEGGSNCLATVKSHTSDVGTMTELAARVLQNLQDELKDKKGDN